MSCIFTQAEVDRFHVLWASSETDVLHSSLSLLNQETQCDNKCYYFYVVRDANISLTFNARQLNT
jgi:hypothetical protein